MTNTSHFPSTSAFHRGLSVIAKGGTGQIIGKRAKEELAIFDILTRPEPALSGEGREEVKKVARQLLGRIHSLLGLDWRKKNQARARVQMAVEDMLYSLHHDLPGKYTDELYKQKCRSVFQHLFEKYVYSEVA